MSDYVEKVLFTKHTAGGQRVNVTRVRMAHNNRWVRTVAINGLSLELDEERDAGFIAGLMSALNASTDRGVA